MTEEQVQESLIADIEREDYLIGELARCMTLHNIYLDREEYERCAVIKVRLDRINKELGPDFFKIDDDDEI